VGAVKPAFWIFLAAFAFLFGLQLYKHEEAHALIYANFGVGSATHFGDPSYVEPSAGDLAKLSTEDYRVVMALQAENDIIGYHVLILYLVLGLAAAALICEKG
jgi:hypothetical protein